MDYILYEKNLNYREEAALHFTLHIIGIPKDLSFSCLDLAQSFLQQNNLKHREVDGNVSIENLATKDMFYYFIDIPTGIQFGKSSMRSKFLIEFSRKLHDYVDIPRNLICFILDREDRKNWKNCDSDQQIQTKIKNEILNYKIN